MSLIQIFSLIASAITIFMFVGPAVEKVGSFIAARFTQTGRDISEISENKSILAIHIIAAILRGTMAVITLSGFWSLLAASMLTTDPGKKDAMMALAIACGVAGLGYLVLLSFIAAKFVAAHRRDDHSHKGD